MVSENVGTLKQQLAKLFDESLRATVPDELDVEPLIAACNPKFGDYQCNNAMSLWTKVKGKGSEFKGPQAIGQKADGWGKSPIAWFHYKTATCRVELKPFKMWSQHFIS